MRLCFNFLANCQKNLQSIDKGDYKVPDIVITDNPNFLYNKDFADDIDDVPAPSPVNLMPISFTIHKHDRGFSVSNKSFFEKSDDEQGDLGTNIEVDKEPLPAPVTITKCQKCHELLILKDSLTDEIKQLETSKKAVESKLHKENKARVTCLKSKE